MPPTQETSSLARIHKEQSDLISLDAQRFIATATDLLGSERFTTLGMALMALTGRRSAEIFFSAKFSLPEKKQPFPALIFAASSKPAKPQGTSFEPLSHSRPGCPKARSGRF